MKSKWKADEMEMSINFKAMRLSWVFVGVALIIWGIIGYIKNGDMPSIPFIILVAQIIIFFLAKLLIARRLAGKNKKSNENNEE